jgi:hypothetical protein
VLLFHVARLDVGRAGAARLLVLPALLVGAAFGATLVFAPLSWAHIASWIGLTVLALAWSARTQPQAFARLPGLFASMRNTTRRWAQGQ